MDNGVVPTKSPIESTAILTSFSTHTNTLSIIEASSELVKSSQGPYSFAVHSGTTTWLGGKTPSATESFVIKTSAITVMPIPPGSLASALTDSDAPTYTTLTSTSTSSRIFTETVTESFSTPTASAKPFTGLAPYGWKNSSLTTLVTVKATGVGHGIVHATGFSPLPKMPVPSAACKYFRSNFS